MWKITGDYFPINENFTDFTTDTLTTNILNVKGDTTFMGYIKAKQYLNLDGNEMIGPTGPIGPIGPQGITGPKGP